MVYKESIERVKLKGIVRAILEENGYAVFVPIVNREIDKRDIFTVQRILKNIRILLKL